MDIKNRESGLDIVRSLAVLFVICIHFYLNCGYYNVPLNSPKLFVMTAARWLFLICVPLFMMLTGYFKSEKTVSKAHYLSLVPLFVAYILISIFKMLFVNLFQKGLYTFKFGITTIANYQIAWYMGMYLSLVLILPFLNKMWKGCNGRKEHNILIVSLAFISMLYPVVQYIAPSYWQMLYPLAYYFLGIYIKEYRPRVNKIVLFIVALLMVGIEAIVSYKGAAGGIFLWNILGSTDCGYSTITVAITAICVFLIFYDVKINSKVLVGAFKSISKCSFEMYLFSGAYDAVIFYFLKRYVAEGEGFFWWIFVTVPVSFILSWISSVIYQKVYSLVNGVVVKSLRK